MAETSGFGKAENAAGRKLKPAYEGRMVGRFITTPATYSAQSVDDTMASGQFIPAGARVVGVKVGNGTGASSSTLNVGLRKRDGTVVDATALASLNAITTAKAPTEVVSGTKLTAGQDYVLADDCEVYFTFKGATSSADQRISVLVMTIEP